MAKIRHTGIVVKDMEKSLHFYNGLLGFKIEKDKRESGPYADKILGMRDTDIRTVKLSDAKGALIELLYYYRRPRNKDGTGKIDDIGYSHLAISVNDINREYRRLKKEGIPFNSTPQVSPDGYAKVAFCRDPDGAFIELVEVLDKTK